MIVRSSEIAARELDDILAYIHQDNPTAAAKLSIAIFATIETIGFYPKIGHRMSRTGPRVLNVRGYRYHIFYELQRDVVVIRNIRNVRQKFPRN